MNGNSFSADDFRTLVISVNDDLIDKFSVISDRIEVALNEGSNLQSDTRELLERLDSRIEDLVLKVKEINSTIPR